MRRINLLILCFLCTVMVFSQENQAKSTVKKEKKQLFNKPVLFKDRIVFDFFSSIWSIPSELNIKQKPVNFGFNGGFMFDLPVKKNHPFSFGLGLGVTNHNLYSNARWYGDTAHQTAVTAVDVKYSKNKITFTNINIPFELRYRHHNSGFKISAGVRIGLMADIHTKYFGSARDRSDGKELIKDYDVPNRTKIPVEFTFKTGWKFVSLNFSYMITKMFEVDNGPQIYPMSFGITLCPY